MIINQLDLSGSSHPWLNPTQGQIVGSQAVERGQTIIWAKGGDKVQFQVSFYLKQWQAIGGNAAGSIAATQLLLKQMEELSNNPQMQPVFIQWAATGEPGASLNTTDLHDGWYVIDNFQPDYRQYIVTGRVACKMTATLAAPSTAPSAIAYPGGAYPTLYGFNQGQLRLAAPVGSLNGWATAPGAEGAIPFIQQTLAAAHAVAPNPFPWRPPPTVAGMFVGGVHLYDTMAVNNANPVPTNGAFIHASWVEVFGSSHQWIGDCFFTNGLIGAYIQNPANPAAITWWTWNNLLGPAQWQSSLTLNVFDHLGTAATVTANPGIDFIGLERGQIQLSWSSSNGDYATLQMTMKRGDQDARIDPTFMNYTAPINAVQLTDSSSGIIAWDFANTADSSITADLGVTAVAAGDHGVAAAMHLATNIMFGFAHLTAPASDINVTANALNLGDTSILPGQQSQKAIFSTPAFANTLNLQANANGGVMTGSWVSVVSATAQNGHAAQLPISGTGTVTFGTSWSPPAGFYQPRFRILSSGNPGNPNEMKLGLVIAGTPVYWIFEGSATPSVITYTWVRGPVIWFSGSQTVQFIAAKGAGAVDVNWNMDEAFLAPLTLVTAGVAGSASVATPTSPWVISPDSGSAGAQTCRLPSGSTLGSATTWLPSGGSAVTPIAGTYQLAARMRNASLPTLAGEVAVQVVVASSITTVGQVLAPQSSRLTNSWLYGAPFTLNGSQSISFRAVNPVMTSVHWYVDEALLLPCSPSGLLTGPLDAWNALVYDVSPEWV